MTKIAIILGTNRTARIGMKLAEWVQKTMQANGQTVDIIDLKEENLPFLDEPDIPAHSYGHYQADFTQAWSQKIESYDGFVFLFPQYNWGYPAVMKNALDYLFNEWAGKPVSVMCYGNHGGFQGQIAMSLVVQGLHMVSVPTNPGLIVKDAMLGEDGQIADVDRALVPFKASVAMVTDELNSVINH